MGGYKNRILCVNFTEAKFSEDSLSEDLVHDYINGRGFGIKRCPEEIVSMDIEVLLFGKLRELSGIREIVVSVGKDARISDLIEQLGERFGSAFQIEVDHLQGLRILINGREHGLLGGRETRLRHKDNVVFLPPIAGG